MHKHIRENFTACLTFLDVIKSSKYRVQDNGNCFDIIEITNGNALGRFVFRIPIETKTDDIVFGYAKGKQYTKFLRIFKMNEMEEKSWIVSPKKQTWKKQKTIPVRQDLGDCKFIVGNESGLFPYPFYFCDRTKFICKQKNVWQYINVCLCVCGVNGMCEGALEYLDKRKKQKKQTKSI